MAKTPEIMQAGSTGAISSAPKAAPPPPAPMRWYRVISGDKAIPRAGGAPYLLKQGHEINNANHDVVKIKQMGVQLEEIEPPAWWIAAQEAGIRRADELRARGLPVPEPVRDISTLMPPPPVPRNAA